MSTVISLEEMQADLKRQYDARKAKHPYPGGWREHSQFSELEEVAALATTGRRPDGSTFNFERCAFSLPEGHLPGYMWDSIDFGTIGHADVPRMPNIKTRLIEGRLHATRGWLMRNVVVGWKAQRFSEWFCENRKAVRRVKVEQHICLYDVADLIAVIVARKTRLVDRLRPNVARVLQGGGSINEKLLEFVATTE